MEKLKRSIYQAGRLTTRGKKLIKGTPQCVRFHHTKREPGVSPGGFTAESNMLTASYKNFIPTAGSGREELC